MAGELHNALTTNANLLAGVRRMMGEMQVDFDGVMRLSESLQAGFDPFSRVEWATLRGERHYRRADNSPAVAARFSAFEFINAAGSNTLAVVYKVENDAGAPELELATDVGPAIGANQVNNGGQTIDTRNTFGQVSVCRMVGSDLAAGTSIRQQRIAVSGESDLPWVIAPGGKLFVIGLTVNTAISVGLSWWERPILPPELTLRSG